MALWLMLDLRHALFLGRYVLVFVGGGGDLIKVSSLKRNTELLSTPMKQALRCCSNNPPMSPCRGELRRRHAAESCYHLHCLLTDGRVAQTAFGFNEDNRKRGGK